MAQRKETESALVAAAKALEQELVAFAATRQAIDHAPLASQRHLERAAQLLSAVAGIEEQLHLRVGELARVLQEADTARRVQAEAILTRASQIEARSHVLRGLVDRHGELGRRVSEAKAGIAERVAGGIDEATLKAIDAQLGGLVTESEALRSAARAADFQDVAKLADSLRDQLHSSRAKLSKVKLVKSRP